MAEAYPSFLRPMLRLSKRRTQPAAFAIAQPRRGRGYVQAVGTDRPLFFDAQFRFTRDEALVFRLWFNEVINAGVDEFTMPILTEFGLLDHTCQFMPDSLMDTSEDGEVITYSASIMVRAEVIPAGYAEAAALIAGVPNWENWAALLDEAMNLAWPD